MVRPLDGPTLWNCFLDSVDLVKWVRFTSGKRDHFHTGKQL
jgi:hypothetical protein